MYHTSHETTMWLSDLKTCRSDWLPVMQKHFQWSTSSTVGRWPSLAKGSLRRVDRTTNRSNCGIRCLLIGRTSWKLQMRHPGFMIRWWIILPMFRYRINGSPVCNNHPRLVSLANHMHSITVIVLASYIKRIPVLPFAIFDELLPMGLMHVLWRWSPTICHEFTWTLDVPLSGNNAFRVVRHVDLRVSGEGSRHHLRVA